MNPQLEESNFDESVVRGAPSSLRRGGFFYGWVMAPIVVVAHICTLPGQSVGVAVFNDSLREELSLNATQFSSAYAAGTILASILMTFVGALYDRFGMRRSLFVLTVLICLACQFMGAVQSFAMLFVAFFFLRLLCQGSLSLLASNTMAMWFQRRLGRVSGIASVVATLGFSVLPLALNSANLAYGWRTTYRALGVVVAAILLPLLVIYRNRPDDIGQTLDGMNEEQRNAFDRTTKIASGQDLEYRQALIQPSYWILIALSIIWGMTGTAIIFDIQPIAAVKQATRFQPVFASTIFFACVAVAGLVGGFLADRYALHRLALFSVGGMAIGLGLLQFSSGDSFFVAYGIFGLSQGLLSAVSQTIWVRYFGRAHLGKIKGGAMTGMVAGSSVGPLISGMCYDQTGGFALAHGFFLALTISAFVGICFLRPPKANLSDAVD